MALLFLIEKEDIVAIIVVYENDEFLTVFYSTALENERRGVLLMKRYLLLEKAVCDE